MLSLYLVDSGLDWVIGSRLRINGPEAHHISKVARHEVGERVALSDGEGVLAEALITEISRSEVVLVIEGVKRFETPRIRLTVVQALTKSERANECIELLVEAGADEIIPWQASRSIGKWQNENSDEKWRDWIRSAVKQSRRSRVPGLGGVLKRISDFKLPQSHSLLIAFDESATRILDSELKDSLPNLDELERIFIVIGPEGGITPEELAHFSAEGGITLRLGQPILRSAHAGAIALGALQSALGIWR